MSVKIIHDTVGVTVRPQMKYALSDRGRAAGRFHATPQLLNRNMSFDVARYVALRSAVTHMFRRVAAMW
jgi:hypothetical protein